VTISMSRACRGPTASPLFPYTTLFRSGRDERCEAAMVEDEARGVPWHASSFLPGSATARGPAFRATRAPPRDDKSSERASERDRSEEHTSELQSRENLVCRLLLE